MNIKLFISILVLLILSYGCRTLQSISPDKIQTDSTKSIRITTIDGSIIKLRPNNYSISKISDSIIISGRGTIIPKSDKYVELDYHGSVSQREISKLEIVDRYIPTVAYVLGGACAIGLIFTITILLSLNGHGLGG